MLKHFRCLLPWLCVFLTTACASPKITQLSGDTYQMKMTDTRGIFGNWSEAKNDALKEAQEFASANNKTLVPIAINEKPMRPGQFYSLDYTFRLVNPQYVPIGSAAVSDHPLDRPVTETENETASQKKTRMAAERDAEQALVKRLREADKLRAQAVKQQQIELREQEKERSRQERVRQAEIARIQRMGDGSPDDMACKGYGFKPNSTPYAECRQKIAMQRQLVIQQQQIEMERQRLAQQELMERQRQARAREEEAADARRQAAADALLNIYNRQMDRQYDAVRRQQEQSDRYGDRLWNDNERRMRDSWKW